MIKILGPKRVGILFILIILNVIFSAGVYAYLLPQKIEKERDMRRMRGQISTVEADIANMQVEFGQLELQQAEFDELKKRGFFSTQGRREAEKMFLRIQEEAGVVSAVASIQSGALIEDDEAAKSNHQILESAIEIRVDAVEDADIFKYIYLLETYFPGHISLKEITLERRADISSTVLRSIASGVSPALVRANMLVSWKTMIPQSENSANGQGGF